MVREFYISLYRDMDQPRNQDFSPSVHSSPPRPNIVSSLGAAVLIDEVKGAIFSFCSFSNSPTGWCSRYLLPKLPGGSTYDERLKIC